MSIKGIFLTNKRISSTKTTLDNNSILTPIHTIRGGGNIQTYRGGGNNNNQQPQQQQQYQQPPIPYQPP